MWGFRKEPSKKSMAARASTARPRISTTRIRPPGWTRFEGKLRPHLFDLNKLQPTDLHDAEGVPSTFLGNNDVQLSVSRRSKPMPFYFRNADGDELYFVHRGEGTIETDFGPLAFEKGDYIVLPRAVTYRVVPRRRGQFLPDHSVEGGVRSAG